MANKVFKSYYSSLKYGDRVVLGIYKSNSYSSAQTAYNSNGPEQVFDVEYVGTFTKYSNTTYTAFRPIVEASYTSSVVSSTSSSLGRGILNIAYSLTDGLTYATNYSASSSSSNGYFYPSMDYATSSSNRYWYLHILKVYRKG